MSRNPRPEDEIQEAKILGQALATLRKSRGLTQIELGQKAGLPHSRIAAECKAGNGGTMAFQYSHSPPRLEIPQPYGVVE